MKLFVFTIIFSAFIAIKMYSQSNHTIQQDTLKWYIYIGGKPHMGRIMCEQKVANNWGIKTEYFYGDCGGTFDFMEKEFEIKNQATFEFLKQTYGEKWREKFDLEVQKEFANSE